MTPNDIHAFKRTLEGLFQVYEIPATEDIATAWWAVMQPLTIEQFQKAVSQYIATGTNRPRPAHILELAGATLKAPDVDTFLAKCHTVTDEPIWLLARAWMVYYHDQPYPVRKERAQAFLAEWDKHLKRAQEGPFDRQEEHILRKYLPHSKRPLPVLLPHERDENGGRKALPDEKTEGELIAEAVKTGAVQWIR